MYHLFMGQTYYPGGGMQDYIDAFASIEDAKQYIAEYEETGYFLGWAMITVTVEGKLKTSLVYGRRFGVDDYDDTTLLAWREVT